MVLIPGIFFFEFNHESGSLEEIGLLPIGEEVDFIDLKFLQFLFLVQSIEGLRGAFEER